MVDAGGLFVFCSELCAQVAQVGGDWQEVYDELVVSMLVYLVDLDPPLVVL